MYYSIINIIISLMKKGKGGTSSIIWMYEKECNMGMMAEASIEDNQKNSTELTNSAM